MNKEAVISDTVHTHSHAPQSNKYKGDFLSQRALPKTYGEEGHQHQDYNLLTWGKISTSIIAWQELSNISQNLMLLERNMNLWGNTVSFTQRPLSLTPSFHKQARTSSTPLCESILTPHCQQEPIHIPLPSNSLFCSALLSLALPFSAKSQIGGWGVFCGPNKRAKVVRTPLYESVGGEQWPKQLVFQAWAYTDQQAWAVAWQQ